MKYFTKEWWASGGEDERCIYAYSEYLDSVRGDLPSGVVDLIDNHTLHDSTLISIAVDVNRQTIEMITSGWDCKFANKLIYTLSFLGLTSFRMLAEDGVKENFEANGIGDLGYYEFEISPEHEVEARMLFSSGAEMIINFEQLIVNTKYL